MLSPLSIKRTKLSNPFFQEMIPRNIIQSWKTHTLPKGLDRQVDHIKKINPTYSYKLYDDEECRRFLEDEFGTDYAEAFDDLIPGAFKCDLWRYAMLYAHGGVYMDIDLEELVPLDQIISPTDRLVTVVDRKLPEAFRCALYQAFLAVEPRHPIMKMALETSLKNVVQRKPVYKKTLFDITGPVVLGRALNDYLGRDEEDDILPGWYPGQKIRLYEFEPSGKFVITSSGKKLFTTEVEYNPSDHYAKIREFYRDSKRPKTSSSLVVLGVLIVFLIVVSTSKL